MTRITDEAVEKALHVYYDGAYDPRAYNPATSGEKFDAMRAALEAALPHLAPQPIDREALEQSIRAELVQQGVDEFHDPMPLGRHLADAVLALINGSAK